MHVKCGPINERPIIINNEFAVQMNLGLDAAPDTNPQARLWAVRLDAGNGEGDRTIREKIAWPFGGSAAWPWARREEGASPL
jgi:hypothetical protein